MNEQELLYYFPYAIDKENNFRHFVNEHNGFQKRHIPNYDGTNTQEFLYEKSGLSISEIHNFEYLYENFHHWSEWFKNGKNIFSFSRELLSMLEKTDVSNITPNNFHLPYDIFYISLKPLNIKIANGRNEIIEGVYVDHNIWNGLGKHPEGYCDLSFYFVGDFKNLFLEYIPNVKSRLEYTEGNYDETPIGSFWNIWLWFEKNEGRETVKQATDYFIQGLKDEIFLNKSSEETVTDFDLDFYNSTVDLLKSTINLVINCLLYLSQPVEKTDIEQKFPKGLPNNFDKKISFAKTHKDLNNITEKIKQIGFSKINYVGQSFKRMHTGITGNTTVQPHWRRGHWRNQKFGEKLKESRMVWILPTIVNSDKGEPVKGHLYNLQEKQRTANNT